MPVPEPDILLTQLTEAFPVHLIFDANFQIIEIGLAVLRLFPDLAVGSEMPKIFELGNFSDSSIGFENIGNEPDKDYFLTHRSQPFCLKGKILTFSKTGLFIFFGIFSFDNRAGFAESANDAEDFREFSDSHIAFDSNPELKKSINKFLSPAKNESAEWKELISRVVGDLCVEFGWDLSVLWIFNHHQKTLVCRHVWGRRKKQTAEFEKETQKIVFASGIGLPGKVFAQSKPVWIKDMINGETFFPPVFAVKRKLFGAACFPIFNNRKIIGVLEVFSGKPQPYNPKCVTLFSDICQNIGSFIESKVLEEMIFENLQKRERELQELGHAKAASYQKSIFLANLSHEIRTPLNAVIGLTELLLETRLSREQSEFLGSIQANSENLLGLINETLDFSKIEAGEMKIEEFEFDLYDVVENVVESLYFKAEKKGVSLYCDIEPGLPSKLRGDANKVRQILLNLVGNAVKFTDKGEIAVKGSFINSHIDDRILLKFSVKDTGIGIPEEFHERIFDKFTRVPESVQEKSGTGLGLSICKSLIESMSGNIKVESEPGKGSNFLFNLRMLAVKDLPHISENIFGGQKILLFGNGSKRLSSLAGNLAFSGLEVHECETLDELNDKFSLTGFDVIICENLSKDKERILQEITNNPAFCATEFLLFVPHSEADSSTNGFPQNVHFLYKPVRLKHLLAKLCDIFQLENDFNIKILPQAEQTRKIVDDYRILLVEDNADNQKVALKILQKAGYIADLAENGLIAFEKFKLNKYDAVLLDLEMPVMSGFKAASEIRKFEQENRQAQTPLIALSAHAVKGVREKCLNAGMDEYLTKPIKKNLLLQTIENHINLRPLIFVVDDSHEIRNLLENYLRKENYRLIFAENGRDALREFDKNAVSMVLLDMQMPVFDGYETAAELRKIGFEKPIIALTGSDSSSEYEKCLASGCSDFLLKPFKKQDVLQILEQNLSKPESIEQLPDCAKQTVFIDSEILDLVPDYLQTRYEDVSKLRHFIKVGNTEAIHTISHQMKGSGAGYGFYEITALGKEIETAVKTTDFPQILKLTDDLENYLNQITYHAQINEPDLPVTRF